MGASNLVVPSSLAAQSALSAVSNVGSVSGSTSLVVGRDMWYSDSSRPAFGEQHFSITVPAGGLSLKLSAELEPTFDVANSWPAMHEVALKIDTGAWATYTFGTGERTKVWSVALSAGPRTISVREGTRAYATGAVWATLCRARAAMTTIAPTAPTRRLVVLGDSISTGFLCDHPTTDAWPILIRDAGTWAVNVHSGGGWRLADLPTGAAIASAFDGTASNVGYLAVGYNDAAALMTAAAWQTALAAYLDALHAALPGVIWVVQSPITATSETFGGTITLTQYRTAVNTVCSTRYPWALEVNGATAITAALGGDGVHPGTAGNATYATSVLAVLPWDAAQETGLMWLDGSSFTAATWTDRYGINNATQGTAGSRGTAVPNDAAYGGKTTVSLNGGKFYDTASFAQSQPFTLVAVGQTTANGEAYFVDGVSDFVVAGCRTGSVAGTFLGTGWIEKTSVTITSPMALVVSADATDVVYANGTSSPASGNAGANGIASGLKIGKRHDTGTTNIEKVALILAFTGASDAAKVDKIFQRLAFDFGGTWT